MDCPYYSNTFKMGDQGKHMTTQVKIKLGGAGLLIVGIATAYFGRNDRDYLLGGLVAAVAGFGMLIGWENFKNLMKGLANSAK